MIDCKFNGVTERDMDILIAEECAASQDFLNIFLEAIGLENAEIISIELSKTDVEYGESDITIIVEKDGVRYGVLIEDKIDAIAQNEQAVRYTRRGKKDKEKGDYAKFYDFIVAPQKYLDSNSESAKYHYHIPYEKILDYFMAKDDFRSAFRAQQVMQAIKKQKHGYQVIEHKGVTDFWDKYITYLEEFYPELMLISKRGPKGIKSRWVYYGTVLDRINIIHKTEMGFVDAEFSGQGNRLFAIEEAIAATGVSIDELGITMKRAGKSVVLRKRVGVMDFSKPFELASNINESFEGILKMHNLIKEISKHEHFVKALKNNFLSRGELL